MPPEIIALIDKPWLLAIVLAVAHPAASPWNGLANGCDGLRAAPTGIVGTSENLGAPRSSVRQTRLIVLTSPPPVARRLLVAWSWQCLLHPPGLFSLLGFCISLQCWVYGGPIAGANNCDDLI